MKNTQNNSLSSTLVKSVLVAVTLLTFMVARAHNPTTSYTFHPKATVGFRTSASCNSFGKQYVPSVSVFLGHRIELGVGPMFNSDKFRFSGIQSRALFYLLTPEGSNSGKTSLYNIITVENHLNQSFSNSWVSIEEWTSRNSIYKEVDFSSIRFRGTQVSAGFGVKHNFNEHFGAAFNLCMSYFSNSRINQQNIPLYYESKGFGLHMSVGLQYTFGTYAH